MTRTSARAGFTLVEMLVALAIVVALMGLAVMIVPGARDQDQVRNAVSDVTANLKIAQAMAARDKSPRGLRLLTDPTKAATDPTRFYVTELQFIELPAPLVLNRTPGAAPPGFPGVWTPDKDARVRFLYELVAYPSTPPPAPPPALQPGTVTRRHCYIDNLTAEQDGQVQGLAGGTLVMPVLGAWAKVIGLGARTGGPTLFSREVMLEVYPDAVLGASTTAQTNHFAIYPALPGAGGTGSTSGAVPLVGEPTILLPSGACIDLSPGGITPPVVGSVPGLPSWPNPSYLDIIFGPDGKLLGNYGGQIFLWVHTMNKFPAPAIQTATGTTLADAYRRAGEQFFITVRGSGTISRAEVTQPDLATGNWGTTTPFDLARQSGQ